MVLSLFDGEELDILQSVLRALPPNVEVFLVGGAVRDAILKRPVHDFDFTLKSGALKTARRISNALNGSFVTLDEEREVGRVILSGGDEKNAGRIYLDFSIFRAHTLEEDLRARDFTINAMAINLSDPHKIIDPLGGLEDLRGKKLEICSAESFQQDSLRTVRAVRLAVEFKLRMSQGMIPKLKAAVPRLKNISAERVRDEIFKVLDGPQVSLALRLMDQMGILSVILPDLMAIKGVEQSEPHEMDVWHHTLAVVESLEKLIDLLTREYTSEKGENLTHGLAVLKLGQFRSQLRAHFDQNLTADRSRKALLMLAGLYHDIGKGSTLTIGEEGRRHFYTHEIHGAEKTGDRGTMLALSNLEVDYLKNVIKNHMRVHQLSKDGDKISRRSIYRYFRAAGETGIDICLLSLADILARRGSPPDPDRWNHELSACAQLMDSYWNRRKEDVHPPRLVNGEDLMIEFDLAPGKRLGELLEAVREGQAGGDIFSREEALKFAARWLEENRVN